MIRVCKSCKEEAHNDLLKICMNCGESLEEPLLDVNENYRT